MPFSSSFYLERQLIFHYTTKHRKILSRNSLSPEFTFQKKLLSGKQTGLIILIANEVLIPDFNIWYGIGMALGRLKATLPGIRKAYVPSFSIESENKNIYGTFTFLNYVQFHMMQCSCIT